MESTLNIKQDAVLARHRRWIVLLVLAIARSGVGLQFVAISALMPTLQAELGFSHTQIGVLLGVFLISGVGLSLPAGMIATRIGDRLTLCIGLLALVGSGMMVAWSDTYAWSITGRLLGGIGAVATSVVGSKLLMDWFVGREIRTALSLFGVIWPAGIAVGMAALPIINAWHGWEFAMLATSALPVLGLLLVGFIPMEAENPHDPNPRASKITRFWSLNKTECYTIIVGGLAFPLMNGGGYILFTAYGPGLLMERGTSAISAGLIVGMLSWLIMVIIPLGGVLADRTGKNGLMFLLGCLISAIGIALFPLGGPEVLWVLLAGMLGFTVGPILSLPSELLRAESRATGMGLFYSIFYLGMGVLPVMAGGLKDATGSFSVVLWFSALCLLLAPIPYFGAKVLQRRLFRVR